MSLGNVPRRNMSAEDRAIVRRMKAYDERVKANLTAGMSEQDARRDAMKVAMSIGGRQR